MWVVPSFVNAEDPNSIEIVLMDEQVSILCLLFLILQYAYLLSFLFGYRVTNFMLL